MDLSALRWGGRGRRALRKGRCRHEGRYRLLRRSRARFRQGQGRRHPGLDQPAHHRRRGRPGNQRHAQGARVDGRQWRAAGPCAGRRADQFHAAWRSHQDRPARQPQWAPQGHRHARPRRLSASRQEPAEGPRRHAGAALRAAARFRQRLFLALEFRGDQHRRRQSHHQRHPGQGGGDVQYPLQRPAHGGDSANQGAGARGEVPRAERPRLRADLRAAEPSLPDRARAAQLDPDPGRGAR